MKSDVAYTEEEKVLCRELCDAINKDEELAMFFKKRLGNILQEFAEGIFMALSTKDRQKTKEITEHTGEKIKALLMHMHVKVVTKKRTSPSLN